MNQGPFGRDAALQAARRLLGVTGASSPHELQAAYHAQVRRVHPDLFAGQPEAQRAAEEHMKDLNAAYRLLVSAGPTSRDAPPAARPPVCPRHAADMVYRCARCGRAVCARCLTEVARGCRACTRSRAAFSAAGWAVGIWAPLLGWVITNGALGWSAADLVWGIWAYLAGLGGCGLRKLGWRGAAWLGIFPVSLPLAGAWQLMSVLVPPAAAQFHRPR